MPRKINYPTPWEAPSKDEVLEAVEFLGGRADTARLLCKNRNTIDRWCDVEKKQTIDKGNWFLLQSIINPK